MPPITTFRVGPEQPDNEEFGNLMHLFRTNAGLSRREAADLFDVSSEYLRLIERGRRVPAVGKMPTILTVYKVRFDILGALDGVLLHTTTGEVEIIFTSRIREVRDREALPRDRRTTPTNRQKQLGQIMELLVKADRKTLTRVHRTLVRKY